VQAKYMSCLRIPKDINNFLILIEMQKAIHQICGNCSWIFSMKSQENLQKEWNFSRVGIHKAYFADCCSQSHLFIGFTHLYIFVKTNLFLFGGELDGKFGNA
jgi:hypothetical protein